MRPRSRAGVVGQLPGAQRGAPRVHSATEVHTDSGRDNRTAGRDHAAGCGADAGMHFGHCRDMPDTIGSIDTLIICCSASGSMASV
jgi:hypothetical protein